MKLFRYPVLTIISFTALFSCRKTPSTHIMGTYEGNYSRDTIIVGSATANVVEVNSLIVNIDLDLEHDDDFGLANVAVNGEDEDYEITYETTLGVMTGTVNGNHMLFTVKMYDDTLTFSGLKQD